jgi:hypothetical protein
MDDLDGPLVPIVAVGLSILQRGRFHPVNKTAFSDASVIG